MKQVTFRGTGQLNGPVIINKTIELDDKTASSLTGLKRDEVKLAILAIHYPGVQIKPNQIGCEIKSISKPKVNNSRTYSSSSSKKSTNYKKTKSSFSLFSIITFILFWPFKIVWWIFKMIWSEKHV